MDNVIVANDSKSWSGCRGLAGVGVGVTGATDGVGCDVGDLVVAGLGLTGTTGTITVCLAVARPDAIEAAVGFGDFGVAGVVGVVAGVSSRVDDVVESLLRKRLRIPPKKLDFLVVGTGVVVVCVRTNFSAISAFV